MLGPLILDRLTVADDPGWLDAIEHETNVPQFVTTELRAMYPG